MSDDEFVISSALFKRINGATGHGQLIRRNGRPQIAFAPECAEFPSKDVSLDLYEREKFYVNLNPLERETWSKILRGWSLSRIAADEGVTHQAILSRIRGNSKGQGGMVAKNFYVLIWWIAREAQRNNKPK